MASNRRKTYPGSTTACRRRTESTTSCPQQVASGALLRPVTFENDLNEVSALIAGHVMSEYVRVDAAESAFRPVDISARERLQNARLEVRAGVDGDDFGAFGVRDLVIPDPQDVGFDPCCHQCDLGRHELGNPGSGVQGDSLPHDVSTVACLPVRQKELAGCVSPVHFESQSRLLEPIREADVMEHRAGVEELEVHRESAALTHKCSEEEHAPRVVEEEVIFFGANEIGDVSNEGRVGDRHASDDVGHVNTPWFKLFQLRSATRAPVLSELTGTPRMWTYSDVDAHVVVFLVFDGVKHLDVAGPAEVFAEANNQGALYRLRYVAPRGDTVVTSTGVRLSVDGEAADIVSAGTVIIPGGDDLPDAPLSGDLREATRHLVERGRRAASICTGAFLLAAVGALDGRRATTHWAHAALLAKVSPSTDVIPDALFVRDDELYTSAGVSAGIDLALALVEFDHGANLARRVAQQLVVFMQRPGGQSQFSSMLQVSRGSHESVRRVVDTILADPAAPHDSASLARVGGVSTRHLARLFATDVGLSPTQLLEQTRFETAKSLLLQGESVTAAARRAGFQNPETMRRVFVSRMGMPPSTYQRRFLTSLRAYPGASR